MRRVVRRRPRRKSEKRHTRTLAVAGIACPSEHRAAQHPVSGCRHRPASHIAATAQGTRTHTRTARTENGQSRLRRNACLSQPRGFHSRRSAHAAGFACCGENFPLHEWADTRVQRGPRRSGVNWRRMNRRSRWSRFGLPGAAFTCAEPWPATSRPGEPSRHPASPNPNAPIMLTTRKIGCREPDKCAGSPNGERRQRRITPTLRER